MIVKTTMSLRCDGARCSQMVTLSIEAPTGGCLRNRMRTDIPTQEETKGWDLGEDRDLCQACKITP